LLSESTFYCLYCNESRLYCLDVCNVVNVM
jgi:hypothetical protein